jgi:hypothetical protein
VDRYVELNQILTIALSRTKSLQRVETRGAMRVERLHWQIVANKGLTRYYIKKIKFFAECSRICKMRLLEKSVCTSRETLRTKKYALTTLDLIVAQNRKPKTRTGYYFKGSLLL